MEIDEFEASSLGGTDKVVGRKCVFCNDCNNVMLLVTVLYISENIKYVKYTRKLRAPSSL